MPNRQTENGCESKCCEADLSIVFSVTSTFLLHFTVCEGVVIQCLALFFSCHLSCSAEYSYFASFVHDKYYVYCCRYRRLMEERLKEREKRLQQTAKASEQLRSAMKLHLC